MHGSLLPMLFVKLVISFMSNRYVCIVIYVCPLVVQSSHTKFFTCFLLNFSPRYSIYLQDRDIEKLKFGHKDRSKKEAVAFLVVCGLCYYKRDHVWNVLGKYIDTALLDFSLDQWISIIAFFTIVPHFVEIAFEEGWLRGISWALKILTDPFTDLIDFYEHALINPKWFIDLKDQRATYVLDIKTKKTKKVDV